MDPQLRSDLQKALRTGQLITLYQPVLRLADDSLVGAEALARWPHPHLGTVAPSRFVPLAERTGLVGALSRTVLRDAVEQADWWNRHTPGDPLVVSVNVPAASLAADGEIAMLEQVVIGNDGRPDQVQIELTGCGGDAGDNDVARTIIALRNRGFGVAVDDVVGCFAGGDRPGLVQAVKLPRSLVQALDRSGHARQSVAEVVRRAHGVGTAVVAKGVDRPRLRDLAVDLGCDQVQGFGVAEPGTARQVAEWRWREVERRLRPVPA
jgi:EAL domain-containing protein (putative c-di-GMP-specific phosphodiesterase class I)